MKKLILTIAFLIPIFAFSQDIVGKWKTIDDETGKAKSIVEIFKATDGKFYGKVYKILTVGEENKKCTVCTGAKKDKPITGMLIVEKLSKDGTEWNGGTIFDPNINESSLKTNNIKKVSFGDIYIFLNSLILRHH